MESELIEGMRGENMGGEEKKKREAVKEKVGKE
jgi:hypothetical protein